MDPILQTVHPQHKTKNLLSVLMYINQESPYSGESLVLRYPHGFVPRHAALDGRVRFPALPLAGGQSVNDPYRPSSPGRTIGDRGPIGEEGLSTPAGGSSHARLGSAATAAKWQVGDLADQEQLDVIGIRYICFLVGA